MNARFMIFILFFVFHHQISFGYELTQIDDGYYVKKIPDRDLWFVMERINDSNISDWMSYATIQASPGAVNIAWDKSKGTHSPDGSGHFKMVLEGVDHNKNEIWIAFITSDKDMAITPKNNKFSDYWPSDLESSSSEPTFANRLKMFVTVVSSPKALITSHMGVSKTVESYFYKEEKGLSIYLHSIAAQVMYTRNDERRFMINAPTALMEVILAKELPKDSVFIGTKEQYNKMTYTRDESYDDFRKRALNKEAEEVEHRYSLIYKNDIAEITTILTAQKDLNKAFQEIFTYIRTLSTAKKDKLGDFILGLISYDDTNLQPLAEKKDDLKEELKKYLLKSYEINELKKDFAKQKSYSPFRPLSKFLKDQDLDSFTSDRMPIISTDGHRNFHWMKIYEPTDKDRLWLEIKRDDENYNWIFTAPFEPAGDTHYIAIDLKQLADLKE